MVFAGSVALLGAAPRTSGATQLLRTPSFDIVVQRSAKIVDRGRPMQMDITIVPRVNVDDATLAISAFERAPFADVQRSAPVTTRADDLHHYTAVVVFPERGVWILQFAVGLQNGRSETAGFRTGVTDPNGLPPPIAWLIGASPLIALLLFAVCEAARAHRLAGRRDRFDPATVS